MFEPSIETYVFFKTPRTKIRVLTSHWLVEVIFKVLFIKKVNDFLICNFYARTR